MKLRGGFVSNSSTTSFLIYGAYFDPDEVKLNRENPTIKADIEKYGEGDPQETLDGHGLEIHGSGWRSGFYIGMSWDAVKDDETGAQFKQRIREDIERLVLNEVVCGTHEEAWSDS